MGVDGGCELGGRDRCPQGKRALAGGVRVGGDLRGQGRVARRIAATLLQRAGKTQMKRRALTRQQVLVCHLAQEGMPERELTARAHLDHMPCNGLAQRLGQARLLEPGDRGDQRLISPAGDGEHPQCLLRWGR